MKYSCYKGYYWDHWQKNLNWSEDSMIIENTLESED